MDTSLSKPKRIKPTEDISLPFLSKVWIYLALVSKKNKRKEKEGTNWEGSKLDMGTERRTELLLRLTTSQRRIS